MTDPFWRPLSFFDLPAVETIAAAVHPGFFEAPDVFAERLRLYPAGSYLLDIGGEPSGYLIAHPWRLLTLPPLNSLLGALPTDPDTFYLHDLALLPSARGTGAARRIVQRQVVHARCEGFGCLSLVAVNRSEDFWRRQGFMPVEQPELREKLLSYETDARYMVRPA